MICTVIPTTLPHFSYTGFHIVDPDVQSYGTWMKIMNSNGDTHVEVVAHIALAIVTVQVRGV